MRVTCKICGNKIERNEAFKIVKETKSGFANHYYCDSIEYEAFQKEMEYKLEVQDLVDIILGYKSVNSVIYKDLASLKRGYTYKEILNSFNKNKDNIVESLKLNGIDKEYNMIRYIFGFISRSIKEDTDEMKNKESSKLIKKINSNEIEIDTDTTSQDYVYKKNTSVDFSNLF